ncbi:MAG: DNA repair protein RecO [Patescibacteria group bacterium]|nr:DNA repair protein RecO [Patescibacteria group bacterium]
MASYKTQGIILKRTNLGEADRILTIYTKNKGKIKVVAKGVRKTLSKLAGHLELFCLTKLEIAEGRNLDIITGADTLKCFIKIRSNLEATNTAYYLAEIVQNLMAENQSHPEIFKLLDEVLEHLDNGQSKLLLAYFEINFLSYAGFRPELYHCLSCDKDAISKENYFSFHEGGLVCGECHKGDIKISDEAIKVLRLFLNRRISAIQKIKTHPKLAKEIENITSSYINNIYQKEFKSKRFLKTR